MYQDRICRSQTYMITNLRYEYPAKEQCRSLLTQPGIAHDYPSWGQKEYRLGTEDLRSRDLSRTDMHSFHQTDSENRSPNRRREGDCKTVELWKN
jgi:hypothetical protein